MDEQTLKDAVKVCNKNNTITRVTIVYGKEIIKSVYTSQMEIEESAKTKFGRISMIWCKTYQ